MKNSEETQITNTETKIEYSKDFNFFLQNQIFISESRGLTTYCSRLESKEFFSDAKGKNPDIMLENCRKIHGKLFK